MRPRLVQANEAKQTALQKHLDDGLGEGARQAVLLDAPDASRHIKPKELWIAIHLPWIALEALRLEEPNVAREATAGLSKSLAASNDSRREARTASRQPVAVVEIGARAQYVVAADEAAHRAGVQSGMTLASALALLPELQAQPRDLRREQALLEQLATRALRFTSRVSLVPPDGLLLEVKGSLKLFGGAKKLGRAVIQDCREAGVRVAIALAPTPLAALAGARAGQSFIVMDSAKLVGRIGEVPLLALRWPLDILDRLAKVGVRSIGEALRLPRAGFARRFGKEPLAMLDQLAGRGADLRKEFRARERFRKRRDLTYEIEHHEGVLEVLGSLLQELEKFLRGRQSGVTRLECRLKHRHAPVTRYVLKLAAPEVDAERLKALFSERLSTLALPEPVRACELRSGNLIARALQAESLWRPGEHGGGVGVESSAFIELLRARLGADAVHGVQLFAEHRPEAAWRVAELETHEATTRARATQAQKKKSFAKPSETQAKVSGTHTAHPEQPPWLAFRRPLWLLPEPRPLSERNHMPCYRGPLRLSAEPERIETGWWDGKDISRDYYQATDVRGVKLWIFRECADPHTWFLHGFFG